MFKKVLNYLRKKRIELYMTVYAENGKKVKGGICPRDTRW